MYPPRLTSRQWFWALTLAGFLWAYAGGRGLRTSAGPVMGRAQADVLGHPVHLLLTPASWVATQGQLAFTWAIGSVTASHRTTETLASLEETNRTLKDKLLVQAGEMEMLSEELRRHNVFQQMGIAPQDVVRAYITGRNAGAGASTITIDKGTADRVRAGDPVISDEYQIVGRVMDAGPKTAEVRLISDPGSKIRATIVRSIEGKPMALLKEACFVQGYGNGEFRTDSVKVLEADIVPGDTVQLLDDDWPAKLQYFILGVVSDVGRNPNQPLRYEVRNRANVNHIRNVEVLVNW